MEEVVDERVELSGDIYVDVRFDLHRKFIMCHRKGELRRRRDDDDDDRLPRNNVMARKWKFLESKNRTYCDGRCLTGQNIGIFLFALFLIIITSGLFLGFDGPYLWQRLSPAVPIIAGFLLVFTLLFIFRTACSDPGILPRATRDEVNYLEKFDTSTGPRDVALPGRVLEVEMPTGHVLRLKYCSTCRIFRPPRVSHCSLCDACVANFDHHCPWVGNCVGLRNYRYFYLFLCSLSLLCVYIFVFNIVNLVLRSQERPTFADAVRDSPASLVEAIICFFSIWSVVGLWGYHTYLICRSVTTNEDIKDTWSSSRHGHDQKNPFSRGNPCSNCFWALCGPLPPSLLDLRGIVEPVDTVRSREFDGAVGYLPSQNDHSQPNRVWNSNTSNKQPRDYV